MKLDGQEITLQVESYPDLYDIVKTLTAKVFLGKILTFNLERVK